MKFHYTASQPNGRMVDGSMEAEAASEVLARLASQGLKPISIKSLGNVESKGLRSIFAQEITMEDKVFITKYLALMLKVGTDLFRAIDILVADFDKQSVKLLLIEIKDSLAKGQPLYSTFAQYPKYFSPVFINMIKAGEASGNLDKVFEDLSVSLEKQESLRKKIKGALIYPTILISLALVIMFVLVSFAIPRIAEIFTSTSLKPPLFSRLVFTIGLFAGRNSYWIIPGTISSIIGAWAFFRRTELGRKYLDRILNRTMVINQVIFRIAIQRFASTLASLLRAGMPIINSLEITAEAVGFPELRAALLRISREGITKGLTIGEAFQREKFFPRVVVNLISVSEKAGHIDQVLDTLAEFYEVEIEASIKTLLALIEPILLVFIGLIVGVIALSIIVPIYQLVGQV